MVDSDRSRGARGAQRDKKMCRQFAVDLTSTGGKEEGRPIPTRQPNYEKSSMSFENPGYSGRTTGSKHTGRTIRQRNNSPQVSFEEKHLGPKRVEESGNTAASSRPKFSRSATIEWTFEGPSTAPPSSDWIDSFTRQHGLAEWNLPRSRRSSFANAARSSLDNPRTGMKHRVLSKSPSAPTHDSNSTSVKDYGSTNSSFEHHSTDPIPDVTEIRVPVHQTPRSVSSEGTEKHEKSNSWSRKLGITGSQFLGTGWTVSTKRSPTYPLIPPSSKSERSETAGESSLGDPEQSVSIEMTDTDVDLPSTGFSGFKLRGKLRRTSSSETSWITGNQAGPSADLDPVRRRNHAITKLHRSPSGSSRNQLDTVVQVNPSGGSGWLSIARNQRAKIKKCRTVGKLYTTVRVEDDDVSVLVTMD